MAEQTCRVCGCTELHGCPPDGCSWAAEDLCSVCAEILEAIGGARGGLATRTQRLAFDAGAEQAIRAYRARFYE